MDNIFDHIKSVGFHGTIGLIIVLAVVFGYIYGLVNIPDHDLTKQAATVLVVGASSLITVVVLKLKS